MYIRKLKDFLSKRFVLIQRKNCGFLERNTVCVYVILWFVTCNLSDKMVSLPMARWSNKNVTERRTRTVGEPKAIQRAREHDNKINKHLRNMLLGLWLGGYKLDY